MRTKCGETCSAFVPLSSVTAAPNPLATYESETKTLAAVAEQNNVFSPALHPMVYEPGDPRIAAAVASLQYDPHETFKPRPENEVQFLDPLEQEIEYFKRLDYFLLILFVRKNHCTTFGRKQARMKAGMRR